MTKSTKTPRQREAERELRARYRKLLDDYQAKRIDEGAVRRALLEEPGVRLLATRTRRRLMPTGWRTAPQRRTERLDLVAYRPPGERRTFYATIEWGQGWEYSPAVSLVEARERWKAWGVVPWSPPLLFRMCEKDLARLRPGRAK